MGFEGRPCQKIWLQRGASRKNTGPVVRKPVKANPGLKFNPGSRFSCLKQFSLLILSDCLKETKVKTYGKRECMGTPHRLAARVTLKRTLILG